MLHCIQIFTNAWEVTMQVKRAIERAILHKLPIYNEYMCLCWVSTLFGMIFCLFSSCIKSSTTRFRLLYTCITFYLRCKCATFLCSRTPRNSMRRRIEICLLKEQWKHLWIIFSFKNEETFGSTWFPNQIFSFNCTSCNGFYYLGVCPKN